MAKPDKNAKTNGVGALSNRTEAVERDEAIVNASKLQMSLDADRDDAKEKFKGRQKKITAMLHKHGISRGAFEQEYKIYEREVSAENEKAKRKAQDEETVFRAECGIIYKALRNGTQMDMLTIIAAAPKAQERLEKEAAKGKGGESDT